MSNPPQAAGAGASSVTGLSGLSGPHQLTRDVVDAALPELESMAQRLVVAGEVPGLAISVVYRDEVVFAQGFGTRRAGDNQSVDADTVFQIASLSKPIAATVVAALVSDGKVTWDARIADVDPSFRLHEPYPTEHVTIRDLFSHRSGLSGNAGNDLELLGVSRQEILRRVRHLRPSRSFREGYDYSNFGITEGAVAASIAAGVVWEDAAEDRLYRRLGMTSTSSRHRDFLARGNRAALHVRQDGRWTPLATRDPDAQSPAGGVSSTARDLAQWMRVELGNGSYAGEPFIKEEAIAQTHVPLVERGNHPISGAPSFYGLGWAIEFRSCGTVWAHAGAFSQGARTLAQLVPSQNLGIIVLTNAFPTGVPEGVADAFLARILGGDAERDWVADWNGAFASLFGPAIEAAKQTYTRPKEVSPALPLAAYVGSYVNDYLGTVAVVEGEGGLTLQLGPAGQRAFALHHFNRDTFIYYSSEEAPDWPVAARFAIGADKRACGLTLDDLNDSSQGELIRTGD